MKSPYILSVLVASFLCSCKVAQPLLPEAVKVPEAFGGMPDTTKSLGYTPRTIFFKDEHLTRLIGEAVENNPDVQIALQRIEMTRASVLVRKGALLPSASLFVAGGQQKFGAHTMDGVGNFDTNFSNNITDDKRMPEHLPEFYAGLQSSWEIDLWKKLRSRKRAAFLRLLSSEKGKHWVTTTLVSEVAVLYYELLALDNELNIIHENIRLQQKAVEVILVQKQAGRANELAVKQFTAQLLNTQGLEYRIRQEIVEGENALNTLLGRMGKPVERGQPILEQTLPMEISVGIPAHMLRRRPDVQAAELNLLASHADLKSAHAAFFPSLTITSSVGLQSFSSSYFFNLPGSLAYSVLGGLTTPLFERNTIRADYKAATAFQAEEFHHYRSAVLNGYREVVTSMNRIENLKAASDLKEQEVEVLQNAVATSRDLFNTGYANYLEVVSAQRGVLEAELALADTRKAQFHSLIALYKALGGGWE
ncbi:efflux transporter outer membrane subunit [Chryseolinea sp. Jin1]|uniref:Efflux transporter outer membrane subunit n=1 Tax=Chryseolinea lacunae TaxID=2801331 RepID=A0ABS1KUQ2_9BACT|nr:efflux transporter outer membrane subunit [Chryseolinea lacunae]